MNLFGLTITKAAPGMSAVHSSSNLWWSSIRESFAGAWQRNVIVESTQNLLAFSAVYACIWRTSSDVGKMRMKLMADPDGDDVWQEVKVSPHLPVLRKPNRFQTRQQFFEYWITSKLLYGNFYALKERDQRRVVVAHYPLDPRQVTPLVTDDGDVYYELRADKLSHVRDRIVVHRSEIMHDRMMALFHPLVGIPPIYACAASSTQGIRIQANASKFFENMSRPSGQLTAPGTIDKGTALRLKEDFEREYSGVNIGRLMVTGDGLKYEPMMIPNDQAQLIEQLKWTAEDVARAFGMPLYKLGIGQPTVNNLAALNQDYYAQTLQPHVEAIEALHDEGMGLTELGYATEMDTENLLRMDAVTLMEVQEKGVGAAILSPNEARNKLNYAKAKGGEEPIAQQQNWPLSVLAKRPPPDQNPGDRRQSPKPALDAPPEEEADEDKAAMWLAWRSEKSLRSSLALA